MDFWALISRCNGSDISFRDTVGKLRPRPIQRGAKVRDVYVLIVKQYILWLDIIVADLTIFQVSDSVCEAAIISPKDRLVAVRQWLLKIFLQIAVCNRCHEKGDIVQVSIASFDCNQMIVGKFSEGMKFLLKSFEDFSSIAFLYSPHSFASINDTSEFTLDLFDSSAYQISLLDALFCYELTQNHPCRASRC